MHQCAVNLVHSNQLPKFSWIHTDMTKSRCCTLSRGSFPFHSLLFKLVIHQPFDKHDLGACPFHSRFSRLVLWFLSYPSCFPPAVTGLYYLMYAPKSGKAALLY